MSENQPFRRGRPTLQERVDGTAGLLSAKGATPPTRNGHAWQEHERRLAELRQRQEAGRSDQAGPATSGAKHCWVHDDPRWPGRLPALLLSWERAPAGWAGKVALVPGPGVEIIVAIVAAEHLEAT